MKSNKLIKAPGASGFTKEYWEHNYSKPEDMEGIGNAKQHALYAMSTFGHEYIDISTIIDFGFGLGHLFQAMLELFYPHTAYGIEPSSYAFEKVTPEMLKPIDSTELTLVQTDLVSWALSSDNDDQMFDLGLFTSVAQYLSDGELELALSIMARRVQFLYFTVPIDIELAHQKETLEFHDTYAISRSREDYLSILSPHFTIVSNRILESKFYFTEESTYFRDLFYRF